MPNVTTAANTSVAEKPRPFHQVPAGARQHPCVKRTLSPEQQAAIEAKREREKRVVREMIDLYCTKKHHTRSGELCEECAELAAYACLRSDKCPFMETKTFCSNCTVHCYKPQMRARIREVMAFSGPRVLLVHPVMALRHVWESLRERRRLAKAAKAKAAAMNAAAAKAASLESVRPGSATLPRSESGAAASQDLKSAS